MLVKVLSVNSTGISFEFGFRLESYHEPECCETHYLSFDDVELSEFDDLVFDLSEDKFFKRIPGYGIELIPMNGHSVKIPGYADNNGLYSDKLILVVTENGKTVNQCDITECQEYYFKG